MIENMNFQPRHVSRLCEIVDRVSKRCHDGMQPSTDGAIDFIELAVDRLASEERSLRTKVNLFFADLDAVRIARETEPKGENGKDR